MDKSEVLIIDDHQLIIDGLEHVLQQLSVPIQITHSQHANEALEWLISGRTFDLVLLDLNMPDLDGFSFISSINQHAITIPVAIISASENISDVQKALDVGALGFISKSSKSNELINAVECILEGNIYTPPWYTSIDKDNVDPRTDLAKKLGLSRRQLDVLDLLAKGNSNKQIADILFLSEDTIKSHLKALFNNFSVNNRTECVNAGRRHGIIKDNI